MSFDVFVQDTPASAQSTDDIPEDFEPKPIGPRSDVVAAIRRVAPEVMFSDPTWGTIDGDGYSIEINVGVDDPVTGFAFHLRGAESGLSSSPTYLPNLAFALSRRGATPASSHWIATAKRSYAGGNIGMES